jgi:ricin-type beta-trefoil lectin protein
MPRIVSRDLRAASAGRPSACLRRTGPDEFVNRVSGFCLNVAGGAARGTPISQLPCNGVSNERWTWTAAIPGTKNPLRSQVSGSSDFCLAEPGASSQDGLAMQLDTCNGSSGQQWDILGPAPS